MSPTHPLTIPGMTTALAMHVHEQGDQHVSKTLREQGIWEAYETQLIVAALQKAETLVDVGANIGYYSVVGGSLLQGRGQVFAFEPEPKNFALLQQNIALNSLDNVHAVPCGLAAVSRDSKIYLSESNFGDHQIYDRGEARAACDIRLVRGDDFLADKIERIDVLKVDTQGAEYQVIAGLEQTLCNSLPNLTMIIEFWPFGLKKAGFHGHELLDLLLSFGLPMAIIDHIDHRLIPCVESDLRKWVDELDTQPENEGFLNLYFGKY